MTTPETSMSAEHPQPARAPAAYQTSQHAAVSAIPTLGRTLLALGLTGVGTLNLLYGDFALNWQPVPADVPMRTLLAFASGVILVTAGIALLIRPLIFAAACVLSLKVLTWTLLMHLPRQLAGQGGAWLGIAESLSLVMALWITAIYHTPPGQPSRRWEPVLGLRAVDWARYVFAVCALAFGASHLVYLDGAAELVPPWFGYPSFWAVLTGLGHIAAGVALLVNVLRLLAARLLAVMFSVFVLFLHLPRVVAAPGDRREWTMIAVSAALTGAAWTIAGSLERRHG